MNGMNAQELEDLKTVIINKLYVIFGEHYDKFVNTMIQTQATIYGSFIFNCILGDEFQNNDIDISVTGSEKYKIFSEFFNLTKQFSNKHISQYNNVVSKSGSCDINGYHFELVETKDNNIVKYDLDICDNSISYYLDSDNNKKIQIKCLYNAIKNKIGTLININEYNNLLFRLSKYKDRGFNFVFPLPTKIYLEYILYQKMCIGKTLLIDTITYSPKISKKLNVLFEKKSNIDGKQLAKIKLDPQITNYYTESNFFKCNHACPIHLFYNGCDHYHYKNDKYGYNIIAVNDTSNQLSKLNYIYLFNDLNNKRQDISFANFANTKFV